MIGNLGKPKPSSSATVFAPSLAITSTSSLVVLRIETSCDDTSAAIVRSDRMILSEVVRGQQSLHEPMRGVVPTLAMDAIAVTCDPSLPPYLPAGLNDCRFERGAIQGVPPPAGFPLSF
ncbi:hypothetical protein DM01DRAFT_327837 [Hesseltinella vesiculosa]|uniref:N(6)-L-threonylcarbamoyladenine synthase n=1 Tax=Hesseltinella vesiculosa TaxID=101127 RepID=A0A1X2G9Y6_9FUNG|nr:hypothetical protein DM01DRAFT_327837 [Hesseltinella vesiculosa]